MRKLIDFGLYCSVYLVLLTLSPIIITIVCLIFLTPKKLDDLAIYFLRIIIYTITFLVFKVGNNIKIIGRENIPSGSRILFLSNHQTLIDSFLVALGTLSFSDVFFHTNKFAYNVPESKNFYYNGFLRIFFKALKTVPISRSGASRAKIEAQVNQFCHLLTKSNLAVFFEGTRTRDGKINECRVGPALTIIKARPNYVVPILLENIQPIMPIKHGSKINLHISMGGHRGRMIIGKPLNVSKFYQEDYSWETAVVQSDELRQLIKEAVENLKPSE